MTLISTTTCAKTGTKVEKYLDRTINGASNCVRKLITLGENSNSKLKQLGVDTIEIHTYEDGSKYINLADKEGNNVLDGCTEGDVLERIRKLIKSFDFMKSSGFKISR